MKPSETADLYARLGIGKDALPEDIKRAYRQKAMAWHPDRHPGDELDAKAQFIAVSEAYGTLSDNSRRHRYDIEGYFEPREGYASSDIDSIFSGFREAYEIFMSIDESTIESKEAKQIVSIMKHIMKGNLFPW